MAETVASRYIGGVPYGPSRSVGRYPNRSSLATTPGVVSVPGIGDAGASGGVELVAPQVMAQSIQVPAISGGGGDGNNLLAMLLSAAPLLQYLPDAYDALFGGAPAQDDALPTPPEQMAPPEVPAGAQAFGMSDQYGQLWGAPAAGQEGLYSLYDGQGRSLGSIDMMQGADDFGDLGAIDPDLLGGGADAVEGGALAANTVPTDLGLTGSLGELPLFGDVATGLADFGGGLAGGWIASQPFQNSDRPYAGIGQQAGSLAGGLIGQAIIPIPFLGAAAGAAIGGLLGGGAGSQIGPAPTIGRNFASMATIGGDGNFYWGNSGGDNGGTAADADAFTSWFGPALQQQAAQHGLVFNPNMAGAQFNIGGYDNFWRGGQTAGGFFYDPYLSGSPESSALRPADDWMSGGFSADQANAFTTNVLADLTARGVYTQPGAEQRGLDYWSAASGADLGFYGAPGGAYSDVAQGGGDWNSLLSGRQNAITGYIEQQRQNAAREAARANTVLFSDGENTQFGAIDPTQPMFFNDAIGLAGDFGLSTQPMQANAPFVYDPGGA